MAKKIPIETMITGTIELLRLGSQFLETWNKNPNDQAELEKLWAQMQTRYKAASDAWEASKQD